MTQGFDEYCNEHHVSGYYYQVSKDAYKAGAASRQAEVGELHNQIHSKVDEINKLLDIVADKQKRVDDALKVLSKTSNLHVIKAREILKGEQDD